MSIVTKMLDWCLYRDRNRIRKNVAWMNRGIDDYRKGYTAQEPPYMFGTRAYNWWMTGWVCARDMDKESTNVHSEEDVS